MRRRELLKVAGAGAAALAAPRIGRPDKLNKLVFVPTEDLSVLDPVVTALKSTRNHGYLVFDTLYGIDTNWMARPQMGRGAPSRGRPADLDPDLARGAALSRQGAG